MAVAITTKALDAVRPYVEKAYSSSSAYVSSAGSYDAAGDLAGTIQSAIRDYLAAMDNATMRQQREMNPWANAAIMCRRDQVADAEMIFKTRDGQDFSPDEEELIREISDLFERPDPALDGESFGVVQGPAVDDALCINAGTIQMLLWDDRSVRGLRVLDGNLVTRNKDWKVDPNDGSVPENVPRWFFKDPEQSPEAKPVPFMNDEIIRLSPYALSYDHRGLAPMRALRRILEAELDVFTWMHRTQQQGTPGGLFVLPGAAPGTADRMKNLYELKLAGKAGIAFATLPKDSKYIELGTIDAINQGTFTFYEILMKATAISFRTTPFHLGWEPKAALSTNSDAAQEFTDDGIISLLRFLKGIYNRKIVASFGDRAANIYMTYTVIEAEEEFRPLPEIRSAAGQLNWLSLNDLKELSGHKPYTIETLTEVLAQSMDKGDAVALAKELFPYVSQEWVPAQMGNAVMMLPLQFAYAQNKSAAQAAEQQNQAKAAGAQGLGSGTSLDGQQQEKGGDRLPPDRVPADRVPSDKTPTDRVPTDTEPAAPVQGAKQIAERIARKVAEHGPIDRKEGAHMLADLYGLQDLITARIEGYDPTGETLNGQPALIRER